MPLDKLRILFVIDSVARGGAESVICSIMRSLPSDRAACYVVCPGSGPMRRRYARFAVEVATPAQQSLCHPAAILKIASLIKRWKIDVVHTCLYTSDVAGIVAARLAGRCRVVSHVVGHNFLVTGERGVRRLRKHLLSSVYRLIYRWADQVVAVADAVKTDLAQRRGVRVPIGKIAVVPHALLEGDTVVTAFDLQQASRSLALREGTAMIVAIGSLIPIKGHRYLLEAMTRVIEALPQVTCVLVGEGPRRQELQDLANRLGLSGHVVFAGGVEEDRKHALLRLSRLIVLPSLSEGLPVTLLEAMACEKPVVATDAGGNREVVEDGVTGLLVPPADSEALAGAIRRLLRDGALADRMGQAARRQLAERFVPGEMAARFFGVYRRAAVG